MGKNEINHWDDDPTRLNQTLVDNLKDRGHIQTPKVEAAFRAVLRHHFLPGTPPEEVYSDRAIMAKQDQNGQWISSSSQPAIMAIMLEQLDLQPGHRVLEIGAGTGYNAALMAHLVGETGQVVAVDIDEDLVEGAREHLAAASFGQVQVVRADGGYGYPKTAPFDRIILTVGAPDIAPAWWEQLKPEGRLVLPLMLKGPMKSVAFKKADDHLASISVKQCGFMQLRGDFASAFPKRDKLIPDQELYIEPVDEVFVEGDAIYRLLTGVSKDWGTEVEVTAWDVMAGELLTWLSLHEPHLCKLSAEGDAVERNLVPALVGIGGKQKSASTVALFDQTGLAALIRPPDQPVDLVERNKLFNPDSPFVVPFPLFVRQFGTDEALAKRLVAHIQAWDAAGRPSSDKMHIRAYPKSAEVAPAEGQYVIEKQWTKLLLELPPFP